jgi:uncharacterized protein YcfJ
MVSRIAVAALLAALTVIPMQPAAGQRPLGGAIGGGVAGGILGGALGGGRGAAIGAIVGAGTGAAIASQGRRYRHGYRGWHDGCYRQRRDGRWVRVHPRHCHW